MIYEFGHRSAPRRVRELRDRGGPAMVVVDVDGTLTDGGIYWSEDSTKCFKRFGPDDADGLKELQDRGLYVVLVSADEVGWPITKSRAEHMGVPAGLQPASPRRIQNLTASFKIGYDRTVYIADGWHDGPLFEMVSLGICPNDALSRTKEKADIVMQRIGGDRFVAAACDFLLREVL